MTRLVINANPAYIKVMKNDADDPDTTPDSQYGKFKFNSNNALIGYTFGAKAFPARTDLEVSSSNRPGNIYNIEPGWKMLAYTGDTSSGKTKLRWHYVNPKIVFGVDFVPILDSKVRKRDSNEMHSATLWPSIYYVGPFPTHGEYTVSASKNAYVDISTQDPFAENDTTPFLYYGDDNSIWRNQTTAALVNVEQSLIAWDLPADSTNPFPPSGTPVAGQQSLEINNASVKLARPGYDIRTATGRQLILNSDRIPTKIIASGEFEIAPGATVDVMIDQAWRPMSPNTFVDLVSKSVGMVGPSDYPLCYPPACYIGWVDSANSGQAYNRTPIHYTVLPDRVRFRSDSWITAPSQLVRYVVFADDDGGTTSGGDGSVLEGVTDFSTPYVRILRPGAQNPPKMRDVMLDTRASYVPIVATGYLHRSAFNIPSDDSRLGTHMAADINFTNSGFRPFVKLGVVMYERFYNSQAQQWEYRGPWRISAPEYIVMFSATDGTWNGKPSALSVVSRIENNFIRIYANPDSPSAIARLQDGTNARYYSQRVEGVRYYVFALPI